MAQFIESEHPRDKEGKFTDKELDSMSAKGLSDKLKTDKGVGINQNKIFITGKCVIVVNFKRSKIIMDEKNILRYARKFDDDFVAVEKTGEWQGYTVYSPTRSRKGVCYAGFPLRVLVKDGKMRWTSPKESIEIVRIFDK